MASKKRTGSGRGRNREPSPLDCYADPRTDRIREHADMRTRFGSYYWQEEPSSGVEGFPPVERAVRAAASSDPRGWLFGLARLADRVGISAESILVFAIADELRRLEPLHLRQSGRPSGIHPDDAVPLLADIQLYQEAAQRAAGATQPEEVAFGVLLPRWVSELEPGASPVARRFHERIVADTRQSARRIVTRLPRFRRPFVRLALDVLREEGRPVPLTVDPTAFQRSLRRIAKGDGARVARRGERISAAARDLIESLPR